MAKKTRISAWDSMSMRLQDELRPLKIGLDRSTIVEVWARYKIGVLGILVRDNKQSYGESGQKLMAASLGLKKTAFNNHLRVAACWNNMEMRKIVVRKDLNGMSISWSHLVEISSLSSESEREHFLKVVFQEGISAKTLRFRITGSWRETRATISEVNRLRSALRKILRVTAGCNTPVKAQAGVRSISSIANRALSPE